MKAGLDLGCIKRFDKLDGAYRQGLIHDDDLNRALQRILEAKVKVGMLDEDASRQLALSAREELNRPETAELALKAAEKTLVLLKNRNSTLPLDRSAAPSSAELQNLAYAEDPAKYASLLSQAKQLASSSDVTLLFLGLTETVENEGKERQSIELPAAQEKLLREVQAVSRKTVVVFLGGSAIASPWAQTHADAILEAWYPGEAGHQAIARILFGDSNPGGRLPVTFYRSTSDLPDYRSYAMKGRSYRFFNGTPIYPFGFGLSYTRFAYSGMTVSASSTASPIDITLNLKNIGERAGDEVIQAYLTGPDEVPAAKRERMSLVGFKRIGLEPGEEVSGIQLRLDPSAYAVTREDGRRAVLTGTYHLFVGGAQPGVALPENPGIPILETRIKLTGPEVPLDK